MADKDLVNEKRLKQLAVSVIDAPSSTTLTDEQYNAILGGVFINGTFLGLEKPIMLPPSDYPGSGRYEGIMIGEQGNYGVTYFKGYQINKNSKVITVSSNWLFQMFGSSGGIIDINKLREVNGKQIPAYPANTGTFVLKFVNGTLTWGADSFTKLYKHTLTLDWTYQGEPTSVNYQHIVIYSNKSTALTKSDIESDDYIIIHSPNNTISTDEAYYKIIPSVQFAYWYTLVLAGSGTGSIKGDYVPSDVASDTVEEL